MSELKYIVCGKLYDGIHDEFYENMKLLVEGDRIAEISPVLERPESAELIDLSDATVTPGMIDAHNHMDYFDWHDIREEVYMLSEEAKTEKRQQLEQTETEYQAFIVSARRQQELKLQSLREEVLEMRKQIVEEMRTELVAFAKAEGYALIFDKSGLTMNGVPVIAYSHPALDVTQAFIDYAAPIVGPLPKIGRFKGIKVKK